MIELTTHHFNRLPRPAAERLALARDFGEVLWDGAHGAYDRLQEALREQMRLRTPFESMAREVSDGRRRKDDDYFRAAQREYEAAQAASSRAQAAHQAANDRKAPVQALCTAAAQWIEGLPERLVPTYTQAPKMGAARKGETLAQQIERHRGQVKELREALVHVQRAPRLGTEVVADLHRVVDQLAEAGEPDVVRCIELRQPFAWPQTASWARIQDAPNPAYVTGPDMLSILAWLCLDELKAKLAALVARDADDDAALSDEDRKRQEAALAAQVLVAERQEAECLIAAWRDGLDVLPRADMDPRALLGVEVEL